MDMRTALKSIVAELAVSTAALSSDDGEAMIGELLRARRIFVAGAGRSGLAMRAFAMRLMHLGLAVHVIGDVTTPSVAADDLLLIGSGSGATASLLPMAARARAIGCRMALFTIRSDSAIAGMADRIVRIPAPTPKIAGEAGHRSVQPMGSLFEQTLWLTLDALVMILRERMDAGAADMFSRHANLE